MMRDKAALPHLLIRVGLWGFVEKSGSLRRISDSQGSPAAPSQRGSAPPITKSDPERPSNDAYKYVQSCGNLHDK